MIEKETLELLEWSRLCQHLATFAATKLGAIAARQLDIPASQAQSQQLLGETKEVYALEQKPNSGWTFQGIEDIGESLKRASLGAMLSGVELLNIATTLAGVRKLRRVIEKEEDLELPILTELVDEVRTYPEIEQEIHRCIDDRAKVADRASPKLGAIRGNIKDIRQKIYDKLENIIQRQGGAIQETVITQRGDRFVIPVKAPQKDQIPGIVHDTSSTGATLYIEPTSIVSFGNKLRQYTRQEQVEEEKILRLLSAQIAEVELELNHLLAVARALDLATARAGYSLWLEANPPRFIDFAEGETITLRQLRHPLLIWQQHHEQGPEVVPINVQIQPQTRVVAITGPNTGGKTVTLKTLGLIALMAKVGLFIPAKEPVELQWFEKVLADIGDEQSLEQSLSTFSGHIRRISRIIEVLNNNPDSLVLLDEVGAGTDPAEGSALAISLLKYLAERNLLTIASTHYGELKALKYEDERFENASVEFDEVSLSPTYKLLWGIPGRSNALTIAQRLGLNLEIIEDAKTRVGGYSQEVNQVIAELEAQRREQETKAQQASKLLAQTESFYTEVSEKALSLQARERALKLNQEKAVQDAIATAKAEIAQVIRQLQHGKPTAQKAQQATEALNKIASENTNLAKPTAKPGYEPKVGEKVRIPRLGQTGEVLSVANQEGELTVRFGLMKMTIALEEIESLDGQKPQVETTTKTTTKANKTNKPPAKSTTSSKPPVLVRTSQNTLDIRGNRVHEVDSHIEKAIANATEAGVLWIIHGKGTGRLRSGVHEILERHPQVNRFEIAPTKEGGAGVTIAYLN